jgi:electron transfer flavoprotein beta subunit
VGTGEETVEVALPALVVGTQLLGEPRYPTLKGIMGARAKEVTVRTLADLGLDDAPVGGRSATTVVLAQRPPAARATARVVRDAPDVAAREIVEFLVERRAVR